MNEKKTAVNNGADEIAGTNFFMNCLKWLAIVGFGLLALILLAKSASAQTPAPVAQPAEKMSACYLLSRYTYKGEEKKLLQLQCESEKEQVRREIREAKQLAKPEQAAPGPIGIAAKNVAKTTVTYRNVDGTAYEGSAGWAKLEKAKIDAEKKVAVEEAKASRPQGCPWYGCPVGYGYGGYYSGGQIVTSVGAGGSNTVYSSGGGWR